MDTWMGGQVRGWGGIGRHRMGVRESIYMWIGRVGMLVSRKQGVGKQNAEKEYLDR